MLANIIMDYIKRCLQFSDYKIVLFVSKDNFNSVRDLIKEIKKDIEGTFEISDLRTNKIITLKSGNGSTFDVLPVNENHLEKSKKFNAAMIDEALKGLQNDLIFPLAENYKDGDNEIHAKYIFTKII